MFAFWRYAFLVFLGISAFLVMFASLAITGTIVVNADELAAFYDESTPFWIIGLTALAFCIGMSEKFCRSMPGIAFSWLNHHKDEITAYSVITMIFLVFMVS